MVEERSGAQGGLGDVPGADVPLGLPYAGACLAVGVACGLCPPTCRDVRILCFSVAVTVR